MAYVTKTGPGAANVQNVVPSAEGGGHTMSVPAIDPNAFQNPVGNQSANWNSAMQGLLGSTTGAAPQTGYVSAGGPAQLGATSTYGGANMNANQFNQSWLAEGGLANQLGAMAAGYGPSLAQVQAQQSAQQSLANQMAMLGSQRGAANPALAAYQAQQLGAQSMQQAAQQAVQGRTAEEMQALQTQGGLLGSMNQQAQQFAGNQAQLTQQAQLASMGAINQANQLQAQMMQQQGQYNAGLYQQNNQANQQAQLAQQSLNAQQYNNYLSLLQQQNMAAYQAAMQQQSQMSSNYLTAAGIEAGVGINQANLGANLLGSGAGLASGLIGVGAQAFSDINVKKNIKTGNDELNEALEKVYQKIMRK